MVPFANWLQGKINRRGWSVERTAREAGIPLSTLEAILRGERSPDYQDCRLLSEALRLSPLTVCYRAGILSDPRSGNRRGASPHCSAPRVATKVCVAPDSVVGQACRGHDEEVTSLPIPRCPHRALTASPGISFGDAARYFATSLQKGKSRS